MTDTEDYSNLPPAMPPTPQRSTLARVIRLSLVGLWFGGLILLGFYGWQLLGARPPANLAGLPASNSPSPVNPTETPPPISAAPPSPDTPTATLQATLSPAAQQVTLLPATPARILIGDRLIISMDEGVTAHLFVFTPENGQLIRLTSGNWRDIHPALGPDGRSLAFASNRDGVWDIYVLDLITGALQRLTETEGYDGSPSWSPDGLWIAYESYVPKDIEGDLEIFIRPVDASQAPIRLTDDPAADHSPDWSPQGRRIAFISTRTGNAEVWTADLDLVENRYVNVSRSGDANEAHPVWGPDGNGLAWSSLGEDGVQTLMVWDISAPDRRPKAINSGDWPAWSADGQALLTSVRAPNRTYLTGYSLRGDSLTLPLRALDGDLNGVSSGAVKLPDPLPADLAAAGAAVPTPLWVPLSEGTASVPGDRSRVIPLLGMDSENYLMNERVDDSFYALRAQCAELAGWDFLSTLEAAFIPLTAPPSPGMVENWLFTGRAFSFNTAPANAGWMALIREDYGPQTYWRVFIRARFQDGEQGMPLRDLPWDLTARHSGDVVAYEQGGKLMPTPLSGYWIDFTRLASAYGWERLPSLSSWRGSFSGIRSNQFVLRDGQDWISAMLEVYPKAALDTPTPVSSPTMTSTASNTPSPTPTYTRTPYRSRTPTPTNTRRPTRTPTPTPTHRPTRTPTPTDTLRPTHTPMPTDTLRPTHTPTPGSATSTSESP